MISQVTLADLALAVARDSSGNSDLSGVYYLVLVGMLGLGLWTAYNKSSHYGRFRPVVDKLFLRVRLSSSDQPEETAYLRSLSDFEAKIVTTRFAETGKMVNLDLSGVPGLRSAGVLSCRVLSNRVYQGTPPSYEVRVKFEGLSPEQAKMLSSSIADLTSTPKLSHA